MANAVKIGRNDECTCGSGKKYKKCCELKQERSGGTVAMLVLIGALALAGLLAGISTFSTDTTHAGQPTGVWSAEHGHYH
jgi:hypothetical protein